MFLDWNGLHLPGAIGYLNGAKLGSFPTLLSKFYPSGVRWFLYKFSEQFLAKSANWLSEIRYIATIIDLIKQKKLKLLRHICRTSADNVPGTVEDGWPRVRRWSDDMTDWCGLYTIIGCQTSSGQEAVEKTHWPQQSTVHNDHKF